MRISVTNGTYFPIYAHGTPAFTFNLSKALMNLGHEVFVLTMDVYSDKKADVSASKTIWAEVPVKYCHSVKCPIPYYSPEMGREVRLLTKQFSGN